MTIFVSLNAGNIVSNHKRAEKLHTFPCVGTPYQSTQLNSNKPNLFANTLLCPHFYQCAIFSLSLVTADFFYVLAAWVFILSKNKSFQSGDLLKMLPSHVLSLRNLVNNENTLQKYRIE